MRKGQPRDGRRLRRVGAVASLMMIVLVAAGGTAEPGPVGAAETLSAAPTSAATTPDVSSPAPPNAPEEAPVLPSTVVDSTGTTVTIDSVDRIVPVDGDLAEIVFALGLGDRVVATDISATYPAASEALPDIGYQRALNAEPIAAFEPTVVLATDLAQPPETLEQLRGLDIPVVVIEREFSLDGPAKKVQGVADALGVPGRGRQLVDKMQQEIDAAVRAGAAIETRPRVLALYLRGEAVQLIFGEGTGIDVVLPAVGATDVAAELGIVGTRQITAEALVVAAPDVLLVTTSGLESVGGIDGLLAVPGIARTPAGRQRRVLAYEDQYLYGGGPRTGQLMSELIEDLHPAT